MITSAQTPPSDPQTVGHGHRAEKAAIGGRALRTLEVCVDDAAGLTAAATGGAGRIELCAALALGGLTPSLGLLALARRVPLPVHVMIRPRAGEFIVSADDLDGMRQDIDAVLASGLAGVVLGCSHPSGDLDVTALALLTKHAAALDLDLTLHRAFDLAPDLDAALETAIGLGFTRILSSGGATDAFAGRERLADLRQKAAGRITIMPGAGINAGNVAEILRHTGATEVHASCSQSVDLADRARSMGFGGQGVLKRTSAEKVAELAEIIRAA